MTRTTAGRTQHYVPEVNRTTKWVLAGVAAVVAVGAIGLVAITVWLGSDDAPERFAVTDTASEGTAEADADEPAADTTAEDLDGRWQVELLDGSDAGVGYRVIEDVPVVGEEEVVARTVDVDGALRLEGDRLTEVDLTVAADTFRSDNQLRDDIVAADYLEAATFPTATLALAAPVEVAISSADGSTAPFEVPAELTLHGVTRTVQVVGEGQPLDGSIEIVGTVDILLSDFDVERPALLGREVRDAAVIEFKLRFVPTPDAEAAPS